jgi:glutathione synthase
MLQRYLPEIADGDTRVLLIDGEPFPYGLARIPKAGETRGNLAAGGRGEVRPLTPSQRRIAAEVGAYCRDSGLMLVGLDVIGEHLTEFNVTSPTCMVEIFAATGADPAARMVEAIAQAR